MTRSTRWWATRWCRCSGSSAPDMPSVRKASPKASCSAACAMCATTASTRARRRRSSRVAVPSTSRRGRFGWETSRRPTWRHPARPAHRRDRPGVRTRGGAGRVGADPGAAPARQRAGAADVLLFGDAEGARRTIGRARRLRGARGADPASRDPSGPAGRQAARAASAPSGRATAERTGRTPSTGSGGPSTPRPARSWCCRRFCTGW